MVWTEWKMDAPVRVMENAHVEQTVMVPVLVTEIVIVPAEFQEEHVPVTKVNVIVKNNFQKF